MSADIIKAVSKIEDKNMIVSIMVLCSDMLGEDLKTPSKMAEQEKELGGVKTRRGIIKSKKYRKEMLGGKIFSIKGIEDNGIPLN
jgi:hypothetical protein